jgi:hypothetical protein
MMSAVTINLQHTPAPWLGVGAMWVAAGLLLNPWAIAATLAVQQWGRLSSVLIWGADVLLITWGLVTIFRSHDNVVKNVNVFAVVVVSIVLSVEAVLRWWPSVLGQHFANGLMTKYSTGSDGIYYVDPALHMNFMLPNFRTDMYYNGYHWTHQTDAHGFRNAVTRSHADALLLGDSNIYGQGVDFEQTVGYFLERATGLTVVNLARQGDASFQQAYLLHEYIGQFSPRLVFYFFCENDIRDVYFYLSDDELRRFIKTPISDISYPPRTNPVDAIRWRDADNDVARHTGSFVDQVVQHSYIVAVWKWVRSLRNEKELAERMADSKHDIMNPDSLGWQYTKHAISFMRRIARLHGAEFVVVPVPAANKRLTAILERFARGQGIPFVSTDIMDRDNPATREWYLAEDFHFSGLGAKTIAGLVAKYFDGCRASSSPDCPQLALN